MLGIAAQIYTCANVHALDAKAVTPSSSLVPLNAVQLQLYSMLSWVTVITGRPRGRPLSKD